jgi:hypothetical protein
MFAIVAAMETIADHLLPDLGARPVRVESIELGGVWLSETAYGWRDARTAVRRRQT